MPPALMFAVARAFPSSGAGAWFARPAIVRPAWSHAVAWLRRRRAAVSANSDTARPALSEQSALLREAHVLPRYSAFAAGFVLVALAALAASPLVTFHRLDVLQRASTATTLAASADLAEVRLLFAEEVVLHQVARGGEEPDAASRYGAVRAREDVLLAHLLSLAPQLAPGARGRAHVLRSYADRWHAITDARIAGRTTEGAFAATLPHVRALRDSALDAHARLAAEVQRGDAEYHRAGARVVADQQGVSIALGVLAVCAAAAVAGFARRERRLTHALARAVDEETRLHRESERRRDELLRIDASKARLVRGFTHDVKNPIGAADGYLQLLEDGIPEPLTPAQRRSVERARRSIHAALHLIGDLLEVAHAESGTVAVHATPTDLAAVARDATEEYRAAAEAKGLRLRVALDAPLPLVVSDPVRVRQVLGNLISNAVKYTDRGDVTVRLLEHRAARADRADQAADRYAIEVTDTGPGIAPAAQARLFEEFVRLVPATTPGVGIGLAISRRIAQALGGDLAVRSEAGQGSTFVLSLPAN